MITVSSKLGDVEVGHKFIHNCHMYLRVQDISPIKGAYQNSVTAVDMDSYEVMILNEEYEVDEVVENEDFYE